MAYGIKAGDAVFTTNFSFFATIEAISLVGATPILVDIDEKTFNISPELLEQRINKVIKESKLVPKCIIPVDLFGHLADYDSIKKISQKYSLIILEDAAQSFGASYKNKKSCSFGDSSATSFYPAKPYGCYGDGGAIFSNNKDFSEVCKSIRVHGQGADKYDNVRIGLNSRLDTIQAAVLLNKLRIFDEELILRNKVAMTYNDRLSNYIVTPNILDDYKSSWAQYSLIMDSEKDRDTIINVLNANDIPTAIFYKTPFNENKLYKDESNFFCISNKISKRIFSIPIHPYLSDKDIDNITSTIIRYFE